MAESLSTGGDEEAQNPSKSNRSSPSFDRETERAMGEGKEDPQTLNRLAKTVNDYGKGPRWADYWSNILIPPPLASRSDVDHYNHKFY